MNIQEITDYVMTLPAEEIRRLTAQDVLGMKLKELCGVPYYCAGPNDYSVDQKDWKPDEDRNQSRIFTDQIIELYGSGAMYEGMLHVQPSLLSYLTTALDESRAGLIAHCIHKQETNK